MLVVAACATSSGDTRAIGDETSLIIRHLALELGVETAPEVEFVRNDWPYLPSLAAFDSLSHHQDPATFEASTALRTEAVAVQEGAGFERKGEAFDHLPSGLRCPDEFDVRIDGESAGFLRLSDIRVFAADGSDVGCDYVSEDGRLLYTLFASRWPDVSLQEHFQQALGEITKVFPNLQSAVIPLAVAKPEGEMGELLSETLGGGFNFRFPDGRTGLTSVYLTKVGDWHVKARATALPDNPSFMFFSTILHQMMVVSVGQRQYELFQASSV